MLPACDLDEHRIKQAGGLSAIIQTHSDFSREFTGGGITGQSDDEWITPRL